MDALSKDEVERQRKWGQRLFGGCPVCHAPGYLVDVGPEEWMVCHEHRVRWLWGMSGVIEIPGQLTADGPLLREADDTELSDVLWNIAPNVHTSMESEIAAWRRIAEYERVDAWWPPEDDVVWTW